MDKDEGQKTLTQATDSQRLDDNWDSYNWKQMRELRLEKDNYQCCNCGRSDLQLHVHHIFPDQAGGTDNIKNLRTYCHQCHKKIHEQDDFVVGGGQSPKDTPYVPTIETVQNIVSSTKHPLIRVIWLLFSKTGIGVTELSELSLSDLKLSQNPIGCSEIDLQRTGPDHIIVSSSNTNGIPGARGARLTETKIPFDDELSTELRKYLAIRPDPIPSLQTHHLLLRTGSNSGKPLTPSVIRSLVVNIAKEHGFYGNENKNITPQILYLFFKYRFLGQPATKEYILGNRDDLPMPFDQLTADYRQGVPKVIK